MFELHDTRNTTLVLITHDAGLADRCDRVITLRDGLVDSDSAVAGEATPVAQAG